MMFDCLPPGKPPSRTLCLGAIARRQGKAEGWDRGIKKSHFLPCIFVAYFTRSTNEQIKNLWCKHSSPIPHPQRAAISYRCSAARPFLQYNSFSPSTISLIIKLLCLATSNDDDLSGQSLRAG